MNPEPERASLAQILYDKRVALHLSRIQVADAAGLNRSTLTRLERGEIMQPMPTALTAIGQALDIPLADLFVAAGYVVPNELPSFKPYFRSRYQDLPDEAVQDVEWYAEQVAKRYGVNLSGPQPGEDEQA